MHPKVSEIGRIAGEMILKMKAGEAVGDVLLDPEIGRARIDGRSPDERSRCPDDSRMGCGASN